MRALALAHPIISSAASQFVWLLVVACWSFFCFLLF